ncbi:methylcrotonoyl-CoA carboxylase [Rhodothalassium salexigens]|uniref:ATP-binding protein n=1 Tax=Rhodothalassium salexigens TaxID=1086 RepID=UPI00237AEA51|nr:biotin carboxylase N-terminal domain-containing protein [Rhodothalassium salexigens]MBK5921796.1 methylcrotonoyl-CoA carboxylase [Rhodothalassium salexigens]
MPKVFDRILIANRGEIACRIMRTAQAMGIDCVAVYSDADAHAAFVDQADAAVHIGPAPAGDSYLKAEAIVAAARRTGAQAIHPGYGFLSENADFAEMCAANGLTFIGPPAEAIRAMGLKGEAKRLMEEAGVPVVPGYHGADHSDASLAAEAERIGFPLLIKAVAGGGGKGMRVVHDAGQFADALAAARREAQSAFGNDVVLLEKYIQVPRHIEIQVFADRYGLAVSLFERDCSLQRRHQKVVEEAPAPGMPQEMREAMGAAAVAAAKAIGYEGAGTVEFIVDVAQGLDGAPFYFMEMNTRLQVEHPVTEMITGEDLVEWQLRVAAGEPLPLVQDDIAMDGYAVEVRLYAEDPARDFVPATGRLDRLAFPDEDGILRVDAGVRQGDRVTLHYDPMLAKIIAWGEDRRTALAHLRHGLRNTEVAGLATNLSFLQRVIDHPAFVAGAIDTGFIARHAADLTPPAAAPAPELLYLAALGVVARRRAQVADLAAASGEPGSPWHRVDGWRLNRPYAETLTFEGADGLRRHLTLVPVAAADAGANRAPEAASERARPGGYRMTVAVDGAEGVEAEAHVRLRGQAGERFEAVVDGLSVHATVQVHDDRVVVIHAGHTAVLARHTLRVDADTDAEAPGTVRAPMPGKVLAVLVADGDPVAKDAPLVVLEAMKMEQTLTAPRAGTVTALTLRPGDQVGDGDVLLTVGE